MHGKPVDRLSPLQATAGSNLLLAEALQFATLMTLHRHTIHVTHVIHHLTTALISPAAYFCARRRSTMCPQTCMPSTRNGTSLSTCQRSTHVPLSTRSSAPQSPRGTLTPLSSMNLGPAVLRLRTSSVAETGPTLAAWTYTCSCPIAGTTSGTCTSSCRLEHKKVPAQIMYLDPAHDQQRLQGGVRATGKEPGALLLCPPPVAWHPNWLQSGSCATHHLCLASRLLH